ncbi:MAG: hypothetical protein IJI84_00020 [Clostridia bacterium]|nr:hypothetical protein [Clostridia bacterium]
MRKRIRKTKCYFLVLIVMIIEIIFVGNVVLANYILVEVKELVPNYKVLYLQMVNNKIIKTVWSEAFIGVNIINKSNDFLKGVDGKTIPDNSLLYNQLLTLAGKKYNYEQELETNDDMSSEEIICINKEIDLAQKGIFDILYSLIYV